MHTCTEILLKIIHYMKLTLKTTLQDNTHFVKEIKLMDSNTQKKKNDRKMIIIIEITNVIWKRG